MEKLGGKVVYKIDKEFSGILSDWIDKGLVLNLPEIIQEESLIRKIIKAGMSEGAQQVHLKKEIEAR